MRSCIKYFHRLFANRCWFRGDWITQDASAIDRNCREFVNIWNRYCIIPLHTTRLDIASHFNTDFTADFESDTKCSEECVKFRFACSRFFLFSRCTIIRICIMNQLASLLHFPAHESLFWFCLQYSCAMRWQHSNRKLNYSSEEKK